MIRFENVSKSYDKGVTFAVKNFSLEVKHHSTTVLLGTSGCGKTSLLRMVNAMVRPTSGKVWVRGKNVAESDPVKLRRSIGYVIQDGGLFPHRNVLENIATVPLLEGVSRAKARRRALELLELVGLESDYAGRFPAQLSGGQRQRVGVARALANKTDILLMDEPFGALDPIVRTQLQEQVAWLRDQVGTTILLVTHDVDEAFKLGDQIVVLETGAKIAQVGDARTLLHQSANQFVSDFIGRSQAARRLQVDEAGLVTDLLGVPVGKLAASSQTKARP